MQTFPLVTVTFLVIAVVFKIRKNSPKVQSKQVNIAKIAASFFLLISELCSNLSWFK